MGLALKSKSSLFQAAVLKRLLRIKQVTQLPVL